MRELNPDVPINTFSYLARDSPKNEERWIKLVNNYVNANPYFITIDKNDLLFDLKKLIRLQGEPFEVPVFMLNSKYLRNAMKWALKLL